MALGSPSLWATLGISATRDSREIRRAYARRLKALNAEDDPDAFQILRAAYERAMAIAGAPAGIKAEALEPPIVVADEDAFAPFAPESNLPAPGPVGVANEEEAELAKLRQRLTELVSDAETAPRDVLEVFEALIRSTALESIELRERTERWLAGFMVEAGEHADVLIEPAIAAFGWDTTQLSEHQLGVTVVARREDIRFIEQLRAPHHKHADAWLALTRPLTRLRRVLYRCTLGLPGSVRALLELIDHQRPGVTACCNEEAVAWWRRMVSQPNFGPGFVWSTVGGILYGTIGLGVTGVFGPPSYVTLLAALAVSLAVAPALAVAALFALVRPRSRWRADSWRPKPVWLACGWAGLAPLLLAGEGLPVSAPALVGLSLVAAAGTGWAWVTADPDGKAKWWIRLFLVPVPITPAIARALAAVPVLMSTIAVPDRNVNVFSALALIGLYAVGGGTLQNAWSWRPSPRLRGSTFAIMAIIAAVTPLGLWWISGSPAFALAALGWIQALYLASLVACSGMRGPLRTARTIWLWLAWLIGIGFSSADGDQGQAQLHLLWLGTWLVGAAAIGAVGMLHQERGPIRAAFARAA